MNQRHEPLPGRPPWSSIRLPEQRWVDLPLTARSGPDNRQELLRETYLAADTFDARRRLAGFYDYCANSDVPELERLGRTIARWETPILRWHRTRLTNAATEGTNLIIKNIKRLGFGFTNFDNYRLRLLLRCGTPWQHPQVASIRRRQPRISA